MDNLGGRSWGRGVVATIAVHTGSIAFVIDPALRGRGHATEEIKQLLRLPELGHVGMFAAGVEPDNVPSVRAGSERP